MKRATSATQCDERMTENKSRWRPYYEKLRERRRAARWSQRSTGSATERRLARRRSRLRAMAAT
jgi:hypothetical protein